MTHRYGYPCSLLLALLLGACGDGRGGPQDTVACYRGTEQAAQCTEYQQLAGDDYAYAMNQCAEVGGELRPSCPADQRVGICEIPAAPTVGNVLAGPKRVHHYRSPAAAAPDAVAAIAKRCGGDAHWLPEGAGSP